MNRGIQTIAVIGADSLGRGIALASLRAGYATILEDVSRPRLEDAVAWLEKNLRDLPDRFVVAQHAVPGVSVGSDVGAQHRCAPVGTNSATKESAPGPKDSFVLAQHAVPLQEDRCLRTTGVIEDAVREADLIIEFAADELEVKLELFTLFDKFAKPGAILASTSASLSIADMASVTFCADRCIGLRFIDSGVIELVVTPETSAETVAACREVAQRMGREVRIIHEGEAPLRRGAIG